jgi:hypothetical protein
MSDKVKLLENTSNLTKNNIYKIAAAALFLFGLILIFSSKAETADLSTEEKYKSDRLVNEFPFPEIKKVPFGPRSVFDTHSFSNQANYFHDKTEKVLLRILLFSCYTEQRFRLQLGLKRRRSTLFQARRSEE